jgi:uncharacterized protein YeaO (DUF488 family)
MPVELQLKRPMMAQAKVQVRRIYEKPPPGDGTRVLVERIWPRGLTKAALDEWCKEVAPSAELRKWYSHDPERFEEFGRRYRSELKEPEQANALAHLREPAKGRLLTLLTATRQPEISGQPCATSARARRRPRGQGSLLRARSRAVISGQRSGLRGAEYQSAATAIGLTAPSTQPGGSYSIFWAHAEADSAGKSGGEVPLAVCGQWTEK